MKYEGLFPYKCGSGQSLLHYPPDSDTVLFHQDHRYSGESCAFNAVAVQNGGVLRRTYRQSMVIEFLTAEGSRPIEVLKV
jgi:hypothetical protein